MKKAILIAIICIAILPTVIAKDGFYADVEIAVSPDGSLSVRGITNHPKLNITKTDIYTSKKGALWTLNISIEDEFSDYVYSLNFPISTVITYLKTSPSVRILDEDGKISVKATGNNEKFYIIAQYHIDKSNSKFDGFLVIFIYAILIFIAFILTGLIIFRIKKGTIRRVPQHNPVSLTDRQKAIVDFLIKNKQHVTQALIEKELKIPKSSLSRNIEVLVRKGILKKESKGMTNIIYFDTKQNNN